MCRDDETPPTETAPLPAGPVGPIPVYDNPNE